MRLACYVSFLLNDAHTVPDAPTSPSVINPTLSGLGYEAFSELRLHLLAETPGVLDASDTALYRALPCAHPDLFGPISPSDDAKAPYRCHLAEAMVEHLGLEIDQWKSRALVSQGVRSSLALLWAQPDVRARQVWLPTDVYPAYQVLAQEAGLAFEGYESRTGLPWDALASTRQWCVLVCDPLKPWGEFAPAASLERLVALARERDGLVVVDGAYSNDLPSAVLTQLNDQAPVAWLWSLSKGWLIPYRAGLVLTSDSQATTWRPAFARAQKSESAVREAYAAVVGSPHRPSQVQAHVDDSRRALMGRLGELADKVKDPGHGYFLTSELSPESWWSSGVLALPPSVFGSAHPGSVLSSLGVLGQARPRASGAG